MENSIKKELTSQDICGIIKTCAARNVSEFSFGSLHIRFSPQASPPIPEALAPPSVTEITEEQHKKQTAKTLELDEAHVRAERLAQMFIEDPAQAEQLLGDEDLDDDDPVTDDERVE